MCNSNCWLRWAWLVSLLTSRAEDHGNCRSRGCWHVRGTDALRIALETRYLPSSIVALICGLNQAPGTVTMKMFGACDGCICFPTAINHEVLCFNSEADDFWRPARRELLE